MILKGWDTLQIGLAYGTSLLIGAFLGETAGGWVVDYIMVRVHVHIPQLFLQTLFGMYF